MGECLSPALDVEEPEGREDEDDADEPKPERAVTVEAVVVQKTTNKHSRIKY